MSEENSFSGNIDELITPEFDAWWEESGQFIRSGGDSYNRSFAYGAFRHLMPEILAAREAKKTPVWTSADQKAGKLPEVGCFVDWTSEYEGVFKTENNCVVVATDGEEVCIRIDNDYLRLVPLSEIKPIETEAERQQRERDEWRRQIDIIVKGCACWNDSILAIHDAMQSGELKVPEVRK